MFLRPHYRRRQGRREAYWALVESYRTERGPRQRTVAYLGLMDEAGRLGVVQAADSQPPSLQAELFPEAIAEPRFVEIDRTRVRVENCRQFGGPWLALQLVKRLGLDDFLRRAMPRGREKVPWSLTALILVAARLCEPSSELHIAEHFFRQTALDDLLGVPFDRLDDNRLYRGLDRLLPHKPALEAFLKQRFGELFALEYDLLLYDVTSTYFEGQAKANPLAQRGYSRDHRSDCKQVCIGLVVTRCGLPLGYEVFAGNRHDSTTLEQIVETMEARYGRAQRIWALDRGMVSEDNLDFLQAGGRHYIVGTPKSQLKKFERELAAPLAKRADRINSSSRDAWDACWGRTPARPACSTSRLPPTPTAQPRSPGKKSRLGGRGPNSAKAPTCSAATSAAGAMKTCGGRTSN